MNKDDPEFDDSDDNFLTQRDIGLKRLDRTHGMGDGRDYLEIGRIFPGQLNDAIQCWLLHDLYDHSYGIDQPALNLNDCLRIGSIWVDIAVGHQATLNIEYWLLDSAKNPNFITLATILITHSMLALCLGFSTPKEVRYKLIANLIWG